MIKKIKRLKEFHLDESAINEGIFRSIFGEIGNLFKTKKDKLSSILKKIKTCKLEEINNRIEIEKKISELPKENTPEYRFDIINLNRQMRIFNSMKDLEINDLTKEADEVMKGDSKLVSFYSAELAKIEAEVTEKLIKNISHYREKSYMDQLNVDFDRLVKDANKKENIYKEFEIEREKEIDDIELPKISQQANKFIELNSHQSKEFLKDLDQKSLNSLYSELKNFIFDIEYKYDSRINIIKNRLKKARKEGQDLLSSSLEEEESMIKSKYKKPIDSIRYKMSLIDKELKYKKYDNY